MLGDVLQEMVDFQSATLPALLPVLGTATGDALLLLVKHASLLINKVLFCWIRTIYSLHVLEFGSHIYVQFVLLVL